MWQMCCFFFPIPEPLWKRGRVKIRGIREVKCFHFPNFAFTSVSFFVLLVKGELSTYTSCYPWRVCVCVCSQRPTFLQTLCSWGRCRRLCGAFCPPRSASPCPRLPSEHAGCSSRWGSTWNPRSAATPQSLALPLSGYLSRGKQNERGRFKKL